MARSASRSRSDGRSGGLRHGRRRLEFWYEFASTYSYLAAARIEQVAAAAKVDLVFRPFLLGPIFREQGLHDSPFNLQPAKGRYMWRDMERLCEGYGLPVRRPTVFPRNGLLAARAGLVAEEQGFCAEFTRAVYHAEFALDRDIGEPAEIARILEGLGRDAQAVLALAGTSRIKEALRRQTEEARARGIFGAPSFLVGDELFWGNDRLGDAVAFCALGA